MLLNELWIFWTVYVYIFIFICINIECWLFRLNYVHHSLAVCNESDQSFIALIYQVCSLLICVKFSWGRAGKVGKQNQNCGVHFFPSIEFYETGSRHFLLDCPDCLDEGFGRWYATFIACACAVAWRQNGDNCRAVDSREDGYWKRCNVRATIRHRNSEGGSSGSTAWHAATRRRRECKP